MIERIQRLEWKARILECCLLCIGLMIAVKDVFRWLEGQSISPIVVVWMLLVVLLLGQKAKQGIGFMFRRGRTQVHTARLKKAHDEQVERASRQ
jgi:hypothetical protein